MKKNWIKKFKKPNIHKKPDLKEIRKEAREREEALERDKEDAMLSEFSDDYNDFYVDESGENEQRIVEEEVTDSAREDRRPKEKAANPSRKKPVSPFRRKLRRILSFVFIIAVVIVVGVILSLTVLFKTQNYEVIGNSLYNESDVINVCGISEGTNIFLAPKKPAADRIKASFPYYEDVQVGFKIPDTIKIDVTEAVEGYLVKVSDNEYLLISTKGRILNRVTDISKYDLPIFIGPKLISGDIGDYVEYEDETVVDMIENITQVFADNGYQGITEVDATNTANITFTYDNRIKVKLGIPEDVSYKIRTAMTIITTKIDVNPGSEIRGTLDVSRCNETKRSYFDEEKSINVNATEDPSAPTRQPTEPAVDGGYVVGDGGYDTGDGGYDAGDGSYDNGAGNYDNGAVDYNNGDGSYDNGAGSYESGNDTGGEQYEWTPDDGGGAVADDGGVDVAPDGGDIPGNGQAQPQ